MSPAGRPLRIAILAHSTNPRGGVVHALELGDALTRLGHETCVHAPDASGKGFFRATTCRTVSVPASPVGTDTTAMVEVRAADYVRFFEDPAQRSFDVFHAQDGISANALATLKERGLIESFARTVHHLDTFPDPRLTALQTRSILAADRLLVVSGAWQDELMQRFGRPSVVVGNGVDPARYTKCPDGREPGLGQRLGLGSGLVFLSVGGIEARKNTIAILEAFIQVRALHPDAQLVIAGGASLLDHQAYQQRFAEILAGSGLPRGAVVIAGPMPHDDMPALYRIADALVFPSTKEGFGLVVIEAMACGLPVVVSRIRPFTEHLGEDDVVWCAPLSTTSIADAMALVLTQPLHSRLIERGAKVSARHTWPATARAHLATYQQLS